MRAVTRVKPEQALYGASFVKEVGSFFYLFGRHSLVRPAPRAFFRPDRTSSWLSRAAAVKAALLQRRRRLVLDGREHGGTL